MFINQHLIPFYVREKIGTVILVFQRIIGDEVALPPQCYFSPHQKTSEIEQTDQIPGIVDIKINIALARRFAAGVGAEEIELVDVLSLGYRRHDRRDFRN